MGGADPVRGHAGWQMACARRTPRAAAPALTVVMLVAVGALVAAGAAAGTSYASGGAEGERQRLGGSAVAATTCNMLSSESHSSTDARQLRDDGTAAEGD